MENNPVAEHIAHHLRIPVLPNSALQLIKALTSEDIGFRELSNVVNQHPSIAARLLALANSAWAAPVVPVLTVENACSRLGLNVVRSVSLGLAVIAPFNTANCPAFDLKRFWASSMLVAEGSGLLAAGVSGYEKNSMFHQTAQTAGLLHNLGLLCLADVMPKETHEAFQAVSHDHLTIMDALRLKAKTDYCEIGSLVGNAWGLPKVFVVAMGHHHEAAYHEEFWQVSTLVGCVVRAVQHLFDGLEILPDEPRLTELAVDPQYYSEVYEKLGAKLNKFQSMANDLF